MRVLGYVTACFLLLGCDPPSRTFYDRTVRISGINLIYRKPAFKKDFLDAANSKDLLNTEMRHH